MFKRQLPELIFLFPFLFSFLSPRLFSFLKCPQASMTVVSLRVKSNYRNGNPSFQCKFDIFISSHFAKPSNVRLK